MLKLKNIPNKFLKRTSWQFYTWGMKLSKDLRYIKAVQISREEKAKTPSRSEIINFLLTLSDGTTSYLEIGVRNPLHNFDHIEADEKYGVDPGVEFRDNPVEFKMTSDLFFDKLSQGDILSTDIKFDVIFIDGLHLASQANRDISNALKFVKPAGFIVIHDCNPPSHWHARELFDDVHTPAGLGWNGTTWKAFLKWRFNPSVFTCCIDTDWGLGILTKVYPIGESIDPVNEFYEYEELEQNRRDYLNLIPFEEFQTIILSEIKTTLNL